MTRLPTLIAGYGERDSECRNLPGCLARWLNLAGRPATPGRHRGTGRAPTDGAAHCPPRCEWRERIPREAEVAMASRQRTNWREEA